MLAIYATVALAAFSSVSALPLTKRINQVISDSTAQWEQACLAAGGGQQCNPLSVQAFSTLLAAPGPCEQQDAADDMIDLAHQLNNDAEMIRLTQLFRQQPRNAPDSLSVLYCGNAPRNQELSGLFQCQFQGVNDNIFGSAANQIPLGQPGTVPFGLSSLSPPGSCPANPGGKIPDGVQLNTIDSNPGGGGASTGSNNNNNNNGGGSNNSGSNNDAAPPQTTTAAADNSSGDSSAPASTQAASSGSDSSSGGFQVSNAQQAQALNIQFKSLTASSPCNNGDVACIPVNGVPQFAQCTTQGFQIMGCAASTQCMALPLVNKVGTSVTCDTLDDAALRFSAISGGFDGSH